MLILNLEERRFVHYQIYFAPILVFLSNIVRETDKISVIAVAIQGKEYALANCGNIVLSYN